MPVWTNQTKFINKYSLPTKLFDRGNKRYESGKLITNTSCNIAFHEITFLLKIKSFICVIKFSNEHSSINTRSYIFFFMKPRYIEYENSILIELIRF